MEAFYPLLAQCPLFRGISQPELAQALPCLGARTLQVSRDQRLLTAGEPARWIGIVLSGSVRIVHEDYCGNRNILTSAEPPQLFGEAFAWVAFPALPVDVEAAQDSAVLLLDSQRLLGHDSALVPLQPRLVANLLTVVSEKNLLLTRKLALLSRRTTREKLLAYFTDEARRAGSTAFTLDYDRQTLADYLGVDRSAMSAELSKLRQAGLLESRGRRITLLPPLSRPSGRQAPSAQRE